MAGGLKRQWSFLGTTLGRSQKEVRLASLAQGSGSQDFGTREYRASSLSQGRTKRRSAQAEVSAYTGCGASGQRAVEQTPLESTSLLNSIGDAGSHARRVPKLEKQGLGAGFRI